ncbi:hypothetical protein CLV58_13526 [Spirosoma oryzae]|uniref:Uncharacterized protein n=1 Tax=Spirosoma oryzae TaxID=1469603 RepID=A0A2T0S0R8_9BACT|nr:hypothetical protein [Spirosoma oryzae]PRY27024.1 hypothetical protein CLV58_13526 [Spirosoma oryzae]
MRRTLYLIPLLVCLALLARAQSQINGTVQINSGGDIGIYNALTFNTGYVITPRNAPASNISFQAGSSYAGASNTSHVNGYAEKVGNTAFTFPVGDGTTLRPMGISPPPTPSSVYQAAYFGVNPASATLPAGAPFSTSSLGTGVARVGTSEYWDVNGSSAVDLTFTWNAASNLSTVVPTGIMSNLIVVGWNGTQWVKVGTGTPTTTGTLSGAGTITVSSVTPDTYTAYTFGTTTLQLAVTTNPSPVTVTSGTGNTVSLPSVLNPTGGTGPYTYTSVDPTTGVASNTTAHGIVNVNPTTGVMSYTSTPGYSGPDQATIKVCDSSSPALCNTVTVPISATLPVGSGSLDCSTAQILGVTPGTAGTGNLKLTVNVSGIGTFPVTISGSGMAVTTSPYVLNVTASGLQTFFIPITYSGAAFGATTITVGSSTCSPNLTAVTPTPLITSVLNLGPACAPITAATLSK